MKVLLHRQAIAVLQPWLLAPTSVLPPPRPLPAAVAEAIFESVLPRNAGDLLPQTSAGLLVSVADK